MKSKLLCGIPFEETRSPEPAGPPLAWAFSADRQEKKAWRQFWLQDPIMGGLNYVTHHALRLLPVSGCSRFGAMLAPFARKRFSRSNFSIRIGNNMATLAPNAASSEQGTDALVARWWENIGRVFAEFSVTDRHWDAGLVKISGQEHFHALQRRGKQVIFVSAHLGHWEAQMSILSKALGITLTGPFQPEPSRFTNRLVHNLRKRRRQFFFPPGQKSAIRLHRLLKSQSAHALIYVDDVRDGQIHLPLFERPVPDRGNAVAAIKLAKSTNSALLPVYIYRTSAANYQMTILPEIEIQQRENQDIAIKETIKQINDSLEPAVLEHIDQWYMLAELRR
ncbi:lysophospholipid acyltransferase family protein [uncultured Cohaesibacter sp.]|uniref:lysophospholipid acyltransferase family protein n=1 Tax=uncultured Cohaesibacter sp. TaxID=1002546 RepID=UPI0029C63C7F|nr:lysophospholipid acyltransferase family protein [uncultured Cohaesibacter sp.]